MIEFVKYYGLNHSGSHYLQWLIENNIPNTRVLRSHTGWDHGKIREAYEEDYTLWNTDEYFNGNRDNHNLQLYNEVKPYLPRIKELYDTKQLPIICLIRNPFDWLYSYCVKHKNEGDNRKVHLAVNLWNEVNKNYIHSTWENKLILKYENLLSEPQQEFKKVREFLGDNGTEFKNLEYDAIPHMNNSVKNKFVYKQTGLSFSTDNNVVDKIDKEVLEYYNKL